MSTAALSQNRKKDVRYYINALIAIFFMFGFGLIPPIAPLTAMGMKAVGIFLGLLWAWSFVDFIWPSILGLVAVGLSGYMTIDQAFSNGFGNSTTILICLVFTLAAFLTSTGVCKTVAYWFISRKSCIGRPYIFMLYLFSAMYILGATAGTNAAYIVGWAIVYEVATVTGYKKLDAFPAALVVGAVVAAMSGAALFPFRAFAVIVLNQSKQILGLDCSFIGWVIPSFIASYATVVLYILAVKYIFRPDTSKLTASDDVFAGYRNDINLTKDQKIGIIVMCAVVLFACLPSFLPQGSALRVFLSKFSIGPIIAICLAAVYIYRRNGKPHYDLPATIRTGIDWNTIIMLASSFPVAAMVQDKDSGVSVMINDWLNSVLGDYRPFMISALFILFCVIVTQFAHNLIMVIVLAPIVCNLSTTIGFDPMPVLMMLAYAANAGFATPGASVMGAMIYANRSWVTVGQAFKLTITAAIIIMFTTIFLGMPVASAMHVGIPFAG
jgi:sodium-dependent dicarboxylate transporter 2/3/5